MKPTFYFCASLLFLLALGGIIPASADPNSAQPKWTPTGNLITARTCHTATLLPNGQVLIAGGHGYSSDLANAELYDPAEGTFSPTGSLIQGRTCHTATLLPNGQVLVVGGQFNGTVLGEAELYDPKKRIWTPTGSLHIARVFHTATLLKDGRVLVAGGSRAASPPVFFRGVQPGNALDTVEIYDPHTGKWTVVDNLHEARFLACATLLENGQVLIANGLSQRSGGDSLASAELFNPATGTWTETGESIGARYMPTSILLPDGKVLVAGGGLYETSLVTAELYDPATGTWAQTGSTHRVRPYRTTLLPNGKVLISGGQDDMGVIKEAQLYTVSTGTWKNTAEMNTARTLLTTTLLNNGKVLVTGGGNGNGSPSGVLDSAELYDPVGKATERSKQPSKEQSISPPLPTNPSYPFD